MPPPLDLPQTNKQTNSRAGNTDLPASSTFHSSSHQGSCRPTFSHLATHHLKATQVLLPLHESGLRRGADVWESLRVKLLVRLGEKKCGHMIHPDQVFRTLPLTARGRPSGPGLCVSCCTVFSLVHMGVHSVPNDCGRQA